MSRRRWRIRTYLSARYEPLVEAWEVRITARERDTGVFLTYTRVMVDWFESLDELARLPKVREARERTRRRARRILRELDEEVE